MEAAVAPSFPLPTNNIHMISHIYQRDAITKKNGFFFL